jgi:hypothetical protein
VRTTKRSTDGQARLQPLHQRHEGEVEAEDAVLRVLDDVDDLVVEEPRVHRVIDRPDPVMPYQSSRWRQVFQASVATRSPS